MKRPEIRPLTSLRFFAAAGIVWHHFGGVFGFPVATMPMAHGVPFFFVLSGFILAYNYADLRPEQRDGFILNRIARIWPVHIACLVIGFVLMPQYSASAMADGGLVLLTNVFLLQDWVPSYRYVFSFNAVSWSISAELFFYLLFPYLIFSMRKCSPLWRCSCF